MYNVGVLAAAYHGTLKLFGIPSAWNIHGMHPGMKQGKLCGATDLVLNSVLLSYQTQFINITMNTV